MSTICVVMERKDVVLRKPSLTLDIGQDIIYYQNIKQYAVNSFVL